MKNLLIHADSTEYLSTLPDHCVDVVFIDPPYGVKASAKGMQPISRPDGSGKFHGVTENWDQEFEDRREHLDFIDWYVSESQRLVRPGGTVWIMGMYHNIHDVGHSMLNKGYFILNDIVWGKSNPVPQFRGVRFCNSVELIIWASPHGKMKYYFDYHAMKEWNGGKQMRADWKIPVCRGNERVKVDDPTARSGKRVLHQTQKPLELMHRVVLSSVPQDGVILDFMAGVGTTGIAAGLHKRTFILVEREKAYVDAARERLKAHDIPFYEGKV